MSFQTKTACHMQIPEIKKRETDVIELESFSRYQKNLWIVFLPLEHKTTFYSCCSSFVNILSAANECDIVSKIQRKTKSYLNLHRH